MLAFTLSSEKAKDAEPDDLLIDPMCVSGVIELRKQGVACLCLYNGQRLIVLDPDRTAQRRIAAARGDMILGEDSCDS